MKYRTKEGDMLDQICQQYYGRSDALPEVLAANPRLPNIGAVLPAGLIIYLPSVTPPEQQHSVRLWD